MVTTIIALIFFLASLAIVLVSLAYIEYINGSLWWVLLPIGYLVMASFVTAHVVGCVLQ